MTAKAQQAAYILAGAFLITVVTQVIYVSLLNGVGIVEGWPMRAPLWGSETILFTLTGVAALVGLAEDGERRAAWGALALAAVFNTLQAGIGLSTFLPATQAGDDFAPLMTVVLGAAFLFYFLAKLLIGMAAIGFGLSLLRRGSAVAKGVGGLSVLAGLAGAVVNLAALPQGLALVFPAGAAGTAATLMVAVSALMLARAKAA